MARPGDEPGAVQRRRVKGSKSEITTKADSRVKVAIRSIRRVVSQGFAGLLYSSPRPCCRKDCGACSPPLTQPHQPANCALSQYTTCQEIQLQPNSSTDPTPPTRGALAQDGARLGVNAAVNDFMALETESDETVWWLVKVVAKVCDLPQNYVCPDLHSDVSFEYPRGKKVVKVQRLRPATTGRGADSARFFCIDTTIEPFYVPCHLLRVGKIKLSPEVTRTSARLSSTSNEPSRRFRLGAETKRVIYERCRCW